MPMLPACWCRLPFRCEEVGVDAFEINFSCPHGMPERKVCACTTCLACVGCS